MQQRCNDLQQAVGARRRAVPRRRPSRDKVRQTGATAKGARVTVRGGVVNGRGRQRFRNAPSTRRMGEGVCRLNRLQRWTAGITVYVRRMIRGFKDKATESFFGGGSILSFQSFVVQAARRLTILDSAASLRDLAACPATDWRRCPETGQGSTASGSTGNGASASDGEAMVLTT